MVSGFDHQIVALLQHLLNDALEGTIVPDHFHFALYPLCPIGVRISSSHSRRCEMTPSRISCRSSTESMAVISYEKS